MAMMIVFAVALSFRDVKRGKRRSNERNYSKIADSTAEVQSDRSDLGIGKTGRLFMFGMPGDATMTICELCYVMCRLARRYWHWMKSPLAYFFKQRNES